MIGDLPYNEDNNQDEQQQPIHDILMQQYEFRAMADTKEIYYYDKERGIYKAGAEILIETQAEQLNNRISTSTINESMNHIRRRTYAYRDTLMLKTLTLSTYKMVY